mgnify:CR=1 FL=1
MDKIKKNFGFGMMRLPMNGEEVNIEETKKMVDAFLNAGFPGIMTVLSGMSNMEQMEDNISFMKNLTKQSLRPLKRFRKYSKAKIRYRVPPAAIVRTAARSIFQSPICLPI